MAGRYAAADRRRGAYAGTASRYTVRQRARRSSVRSEHRPANLLIYIQVI